MNVLKAFSVALIGLALGVFGIPACNWVIDNGVPFHITAFLYVATVMGYSFAVADRMVSGKWFWR